MEQFQIVSLMGKLEECLLTGQTFISWAQIYSWYRANRIGRRTWRNVESRWQELCESNELEPIPLTVWGLGATAHTGGVRLRRAYVGRLDGEKLSLASLANGD